jgi:integrase
VLNRHRTLITIGRYGIVSLADARKEARTLLAEFTLGKVRPQSITYEKAVRLFIEDKKKGVRESTADQYEWFLGRLKFGQVGDITQQEFELQLKRVKAPSTYNHIIVAAKVFFTWAMKRHYVERNPAANVTAHASNRRKRILSAHELKALWDATEDPNADLPQHYRSIVKLLVLCGQRRGEIAALRTSFIKGDSATLPAEFCKNGREHTFPLSPLAQEVLREINTDPTRHDALYFPARGKPDKPFNGWSKAIKQLRKLVGTDFKHFTLHDIRRTFRSGLGMLGVRPDIAERMVNHISAQSDMELVYDLYEYLPEMREAIKKWEGYIRMVVSTPSSGSSECDCEPASAAVSSSHVETASGS